MKTHTQVPIRKERAQSLVELAISLTVLLVLVSGAVSFGMALFSYVAMRDAAQEGALYGSFNPCILESDGTCHRTSQPNTAGIVQRIRTSSTSPIDFSNTAAIPDAYINIVLNNGEPCEGSETVGGVPVPNALEVSIQYNYPIFMPFVGAIVGSQQIHLTATVSDTILEPRCPP